MGNTLPTSNPYGGWNLGTSNPNQGTVYSNGTTPAGGTTDWSKWAELALKAYGAYNASKPTTFQKAPEDPSMVALRAKLLGYIEDSPTRNLLGEMLGPRIEHMANSTFQLPQGANGYNPNNQGRPQYDVRSILGRLSTHANPSAGASNSTLSAPPPPPYVPKQGGASKRSEYEAIAGGAGTGSKFGGVGALAGALVGGLIGRKRHTKDLKIYERNSKEAYNQWAQQYGAAFGGAIPKNFDEYKRWYQQKYGTPFTGEQPVWGGG